MQRRTSGGRWSRDWDMSAHADLRCAVVLVSKRAVVNIGCLRREHGLEELDVSSIAQWEG